MKFTKHRFSKRSPEVECAVFVVHEPAPGPFVEYDPTQGIPPFLRYRGTAAAIILPDGRFWVGVTLCSPSDQFVKAKGRAKAIGRAWQATSRGSIHTDPGRYTGAQWVFRSHQHGTVELNDGFDGIKHTSDVLKTKLNFEIAEMKRQLQAVGRLA